MLSVRTVSKLSNFSVHTEGHTLVDVGFASFVCFFSKVLLYVESDAKLILCGLTRSYTALIFQCQIASD